MGKPVVLDVDPGCDDAAMLALALASDAVEVLGVTTVAGNASLPDATQNALAVLERLDRTDVPVIPGCDRPLVRDLVTAEHVHGEGGLPGVESEPSTAPRAGDAVSFLLEQSRTRSDLTVVATAPLTNVAVAHAIDPDVVDRIDLRVMGGAARVGGNVTAAAEYNFYADPEAAARVVRDAEPCVVGLDVTERATLPADRLEALAGQDEPVRSIAGWLAYATPETIATEGIDEPVPLHDPAVLVDLVGEVLSYEPASLTVDHSSGPSRGALIRDDRPGAEPTATFAVDIDVAAFRETVEDVLARLD